MPYFCLSTFWNICPLHGWSYLGFTQIPQALGTQTDAPTTVEGWRNAKMIALLNIAHEPINQVSKTDHPPPQNLLFWRKKPFFSWSGGKIDEIVWFGIFKQIFINMLLSGGSTTKAASKTIPVQEERAKVLPKIRYEPDNKPHENDQKQSIFDLK